MAAREHPQIFVTTHQPYLVNALKAEEVWVLEKTASGFASVRCAGDDQVVAGLAKEGLPLATFGIATTWINANMHFEILGEDSSGKMLLDLLLPRILTGDQHTFRVVSYRGTGHIPRGLKPTR